MLSTALDFAYQGYQRLIRIRKLKKNRQHNDQKKKYKRTNNDLQNIHIKLKHELHERNERPGGELMCSGRVIRGKHSWLDALTRNTF
jgi:hypothetical protein